MRYREIDKILRADGWYEVKQVGSHHQYKHPAKPGKVTVPGHDNSKINLETGGAGISPSLPKKRSDDK